MNVYIIIILSIFAFDSLSLIINAFPLKGVTDERMGLLLFESMMLVLTAIAIKFQIENI